MYIKCKGKIQTSQQLQQTVTVMGRKHRDAINSFKSFMVISG